MGLERAIVFKDGGPPDWPTVASKLTEIGERPVVRMIDGLPAFPDEIPDPSWRELRIGLGGGMVTLRRDGPAVRCVVWGTSDPALLRSLDRCLWAVAAAGDGELPLPDGGSLGVDALRDRVSGVG